MSTRTIDLLICGNSPDLSSLKARVQGTKYATAAFSQEDSSWHVVFTLQAADAKLPARKIIKPLLRLLNVVDTSAVFWSDSWSTYAN